MTSTPDGADDARNRGESAEHHRLIERASAGEQSALRELFERHRPRLKRMVAARMDTRLMGRIDPSDVVQEALTVAAGRLRAYASTRPLPFYPWLRQIAWERLVDLHKRHIGARRRSVTREDRFPWDLSHESATALVEQMASHEGNPSRGLIREEIRARVQSALERLDAADREILVMRHIEQLRIAEIAALLGISEGSVKMRRLRAMLRLREALGDELEH
jgi:RNA polymerase sigma-70 factor (ECF subfamily)